MTTPPLFSVSSIAGTNLAGTSRVGEVAMLTSVFGGDGDKYTYAKAAQAMDFEQSCALLAQGSAISDLGSGGYAVGVVGGVLANDCFWAKQVPASSSALHDPSLGLFATDYGVVADGVTDDTAAMQAAIDAALALGVAKIRMPLGVCLVSHLTLPALGNTSAAFKALELCGVCQPSTLFGTVGTATLSNDGSIIKSAAASGNALFYVTPNSGDFSFYHLVLRDLTFRTYDNPNIEVIDAGWAQQLSMYNVMVDTGVYSVQAANPTNGKTAIRTPRINNGALTHLSNVIVSGYYTGIEVNEHCYGENITLVCCGRALRFKTANQASYFTRVGAYRNRYNIVVDGVHYFEIGQFNVEHANATTQVTNPADLTVGNGWQVTQDDVNDPSNLGIGRIRWSVVLGDVGQDATFTKTGGTGIVTGRVGT